MDLASLPFFEKHGSLFAIVSPRPFSYGRRPRVDLTERVIEWGDARHHGITVSSVVESTDDRLVVIDRAGRQFVFEPMTVEHWRARFPDMQVQTVDEIRAIVARDRG